MNGPKPIADPRNELRFTRGAQAGVFAVAAVFLCGASTATLGVNLLAERPILSWWWVLVPLPFAVVLFRLAHRCARHAYLILTPLGIEIFPFFNPRRNLRVVYWSEVTDVEICARGRLVLHFDRQHTAGVVASLAPIPRSRRGFLLRGIEGRMAERAADRSGPLVGG